MSTYEIKVGATGVTLTVKGEDDKVVRTTYYPESGHMAKEHLAAAKARFEAAQLPLKQAYHDYQRYTRRFGMMHSSTQRMHDIYTVAYNNHTATWKYLMAMYQVNSKCSMLRHQALMAKSN